MAKPAEVEPPGRSQPGGAGLRIERGAVGKGGVVKEDRNMRKRREKGTQTDMDVKAGDVCIWGGGGGGVEGSLIDSIIKEDLRGQRDSQRQQIKVNINKLRSTSTHEEYSVHLDC